MQTLRLCVFLASIVALRAYALTNNLPEFYCVYNGNFSDSKQVQADGADRTQMQVIFQPILVTALSDRPTIYLQDYNNGVLARSLLLIVSETDNGTVLTTPYNFTGNSDIKQGPVDPAIIKALTWKDLQGQSDCKDSYMHVKPFVFLMTWQDCRDPAVKGKRENYGALTTCNSTEVIMPAGASETDTLTPYQFTSDGNKYPLENAPDNYVCNCTTQG